MGHRGQDRDGLRSRPSTTCRKVVDYVRNFDMPKDVREGWGYPEITDQTRAKILGLNLAKLAGLDPTKRVSRQGSESAPGGSAKRAGTRA